MHPHEGFDASTDDEPGIGGAASFWDQHCRERDLPQNPGVNPVLQQVVGALLPGSALDLGCGAGGDTLWLARHDWHVTAIDISQTAVDHVAALVHDAGLGGGVVVERHDLSTTFPSGRFDLVSAHYLHSTISLPRMDVLRRAAGALTPGGALLVVDHGSTPLWSWNQDPDVYYATPDEVADELALASSTWHVERADSPRRVATGPGGQQAEVTDHVMVIRRHTR